MSDKKAYTGCKIFDGNKTHIGAGLLIDNGLSAGIVPVDEIGNDYSCVDLDGGLLTAGFVDLQVNGGGGVLFNEAPTLGAIRAMCAAHQQFGTTALLPTLITDKPDVTKRAIDAGVEAQSKNVPGFLGLHLEGPHLSVEKKGAHSPSLIRSMTNKDLELLCEAKQQLKYLLITVAPESVSNDQISQLSAAGIRVSLGHTASTSKQAKSCFSAGASSVTHLYNAMSPLTHREPGLVGAALNEDAIYCGLIADGFHVDPDAINIALNSKTHEGKLFLVTDAMSTIGTDQQEFTLNGRRIARHHGRLVLDDGTLAGADLDMISAVRYMVENTKCNTEEALRMASIYPSTYLGADQDHGALTEGRRANFLHLNDALDLRAVWENGSQKS
jgi:N-acetylglucosamine-6-phosphate deacetylase